MAPQPIPGCRICGNLHLIKVLDLGSQALTGVFPLDSSELVTEGPLVLLKCHQQNNEDVCGLLQLGHSYDLGEMYGSNYGYRSGLNSSMVSHLKSKVHNILSTAHLEDGDLILDIGSNDGTTLSAYPVGRFRLFGIDPTAEKFACYYPPHVHYEADFFSHTTFERLFGRTKAKVITSFSMFYDLENPMQFMREISLSLHDEGIWIFEQSYMPLMLERNSYDTVCHEHIEYYSLRQIKWMTDRVGFKIINVEFNDINGGSFSVTVAKQNSSFLESEEVKKILENERLLGLDTLAPYMAFAKRVFQSRIALCELLKNIRGQGLTIHGLGASTKGNVILQYCQISRDDILAVAEVNPEKYYRLTPGTLIPIQSQSEILSNHVNYLLVLPWHFREFFLSNPLFKGKKLIFPLPRLEIIVPQ